MKRTIDGLIELQAKLNEWTLKVTNTYNQERGTVDTWQMMKDIDTIISTAFDADPIIPNE